MPNKDENKNGTCPRVGHEIENETITFVYVIEMQFVCIAYTYTYRTEKGDKNRTRLKVEGCIITNYQGYVTTDTGRCQKNWFSLKYFQKIWHEN